MQITSLETTNFETLYEAFGAAFGDYEMQINEKELQIMLSRRGFDPSLSFGLFEDNVLKSFIFNGVGIFNGEKTAYDSGTGTLEECRGKGYASKIFSFALPFLKEAGITQYLLEVLQHNTGAVSVYRKMGFEVSREFNYFVQQASLVHIPDKVLPDGYEVKQISSQESAEIESFNDFHPSWQNSIESIGRRIADFRFFAAFSGGKAVGYSIFEPVSGDVTQIAVSPAHRRKGIGSALMKEALNANQHPNIKIINTELTCTNITHFLQSCGIPPKGRQFEMVKRIVVS